MVSFQITREQNDIIKASIFEIKNDLKNRTRRLVFADWLEDNLMNKEARAWRESTECHIQKHSKYGEVFHLILGFIQKSELNKTKKYGEKLNTRSMQVNVTINMETGMIIKAWRGTDVVKEFLECEEQYDSSQQKGSFEDLCS